MIANTKTAIIISLAVMGFRRRRSLVNKFIIAASQYRHHGLK